MPFVYKEVRSLENTEKVGDGECVTLIKTFTQAGWTGRWKQGAAVIGNKVIQQGTAIANFVNGRWPGLPRGNHSAFYLWQVIDGIYVLDQYPDKKLVGQRFIRRRGKDASGKYINPSNNADAFFVIE